MDVHEQSPSSRIDCVVGPSLEFVSCFSEQTREQSASFMYHKRTFERLCQPIWIIRAIFIYNQYKRHFLRHAYDIDVAISLIVKKEALFTTIIEYDRRQKP